LPRDISNEITRRLNGQSTYSDPPQLEPGGLCAATYTNQGKRVFIKDIAYYIFPPDGKPAALAPSLIKALSNGASTNGDAPSSDEKGNPTVVPTEYLKKFHFTFLIRHPRRAIPSFFRCTVPPLDDVTGFYDFMPSEAGYDELRRLFDYLKDQHIIGPARVDGSNGAEKGVTITVIDADDLLDNPGRVIEGFCNQVGYPYTPDMLRWEDQENQEYAVKTFEKWQGFHDDVLGSTYLKPREHAAVGTG